jgi:hypothetical protein
MLFMTTPLPFLNAFNLIVCLHQDHLPMKEFLNALSPANRRPLRFYFLTLWAYFSSTATVVCILLPVVGRYLTMFSEKSCDRIALIVAMLLEFVWLCYALTVLSWRVSGYLYRKVCHGLQWATERAQDAWDARIRKEEA